MSEDASETAPPTPADESATTHATAAADRLTPPPVRMWTKVLVGIVLTIIVVVILVGPTDAGQSLLELWDRDAGIIGAISFAVVYVAATTVFIPAAVLAVGAGFLFGGIWGTLIALVCRPLGGLAAFLIGRYVAGERVRRWADRWDQFETVDQLTVDKPFRVVLLMRLFPVIPFNMANYIFGVTRVAWRRYLTATFLGVAPGTLVYAYLGAATGDLTEVVEDGVVDDPPEIALDFLPWVIGASLLAMALAFVVSYGRKRWKKVMQESDVDE